MYLRMQDNQFKENMAKKTDRCNTEMAALGRHILPGALYDYRVDRVIKNSPPGWESIDLTELETENDDQFELEVKLTDSTLNKWEQMGLDQHLTASTLTGLNDQYRGASKYLNDLNDPGQVTQTIVCRITSNQENLNLSAISKALEQFVDQNEDKEINKPEAATHVVIGVTYGAEAYCVLTQGVNDEDAKEDAETDLTDWANKMESALEDQQDLIEFKEQFEKEEMQKLIRMKCRLYVDVQTPSFRECNYFDAYKHCLKLIDQIKNPNGKSKVVPLTYELRPLKVVMNPAARTLIKNPEVDADLLTRCCDIWVQLESIRARGISLTNVKKINRTPLRQFVTTIGKYQDMIKKRLNAAVVRIRSSYNDDCDAFQEMEKIINITEKHLIFNPSRLEKWLCYKSAETEIIKAIINFEGITFVATNNQLNKKLNELCYDKKYSLVLVIPELDQWTNEMLEKMRNYVANYTKLVAEKSNRNYEDDDDDDDDDDDEPWHMIPSKKKHVLDQIREFSNYIAKNSENDVQFFTTPREKSGRFGCQYSIYENEQLLKENCKLPGPPTDLKVHLETDKENARNVRLEWKYNDVGYPHLFVVDYRIKDSKDSWTQKKSEQMQLTVNCKQGSFLEFRVSVDTCIGRSDFSDIADTEGAKMEDDNNDEGYQETLSQSTSINNQPKSNLKQRNETKSDQTLKWVETHSGRSLANQFNVDDSASKQLTSLRPQMAQNQQASIGDQNNGNSDSESEFTSVSETSWNTKKDQGQNAKLKTNDVFQSTRSLPVNRIKSSVLDNTPIDKFKTKEPIHRNIHGSKTRLMQSDNFRISFISSQVNLSQNFDSETLIEDRPRFASRILNRCKKIGNRNGMELYAVKLNESKSGSKENVFRRFVFGQPGPRQGQHKTILIMGATGAGKTTLINAMINYIFGVEWDDPFRFHLIEEQLVGQSQLKSQTSIITAYDIHHMDGFRIPYSLTIVDTPGYGETKGVDCDKKTTEMIRQFFEDKNGIQELDVIGFVAQASLRRLTPTEIYIFDSVLAIFGKDVKENINFLLTFAHSQNPAVLSAIKRAGLPCPTNSDGDPLHHKFNNRGFFCSSRPEASSNSIVDKINRIFWKMGMDNFQKFFSSLATMKTKSLSLTKQVLDERKKLEATVDRLYPLIKMGLEFKMRQKYESEGKKMVLEKEFDYNRRAVLGLVDIVANCMKRINEIVLWPSNPFPTTEYIIIKICLEKLENKSGFKERIENLRQLREKAVIFNKVRNNESLFEH